MKWENGGSTVKFYDWASERKDLITWRKLEKEQGRGSFGVLCRRWVLYFLVLMLIGQIIIQVWNSEERSGLELYFLESSLYTSIYETRQQMIPSCLSLLEPIKYRQGWILYKHFIFAILPATGESSRSSTKMCCKSAAYTGYNKDYNDYNGKTKIKMVKDYRQYRHLQDSIVLATKLLIFLWW